MRYLFKHSRRARRHRRIRFAAQLGLAAAAVLAWSAAAAGTLDITVRNGYVTLDAVAAPLGEVMKDLSTKAGFRLVMKKNLEAPVTWRLQDVPVEEAVTQLLAQVSSVALYAPSIEGSGPVLTEVRILRGGDNAVPMVEHRTALVPDMEARSDIASTQLASMDGLQPASGRADTAPAARHTSTLLAAKQRPEASRGPLTAALSDSNAGVRQRAIQGLIGLGGEETVASLSVVLLEDSEPRVRRMAAAGLGRMNTESAFWALMEASSDVDQGVREAVSAALVGLERRGVTAREAATASQ